METQRLDKWLWAARLFKTRTLAATAVSGGRVHLNEQRAKPAKAIRVGDALRVQRGDETLVVTVQALAERRGPAVEAATLYSETPASVAAREARANARREGTGLDRGRRPDKQQRRQLARLRQALEE